MAIDEGRKAKKQSQELDRLNNKLSQAMKSLTGNIGGVDKLMGSYGALSTAVEKAISGYRTEENQMKAQDRALSKLMKGYDQAVIQIVSSSMTLKRKEQELRKAKASTDPLAQFRDIALAYTSGGEMGFGQIPEQAFIKLESMFENTFPELMKDFKDATDGLDTSMNMSGETFAIAVEKIQKILPSNENLVDQQKLLQMEIDALKDAIQENTEALDEDEGGGMGLLGMASKAFAVLGVTAYAKELLAYNENMAVLSATAGSTSNELMGMTTNLIDSREKMALATAYMEAGALGAKSMKKTSAQIHTFSALFDLEDGAFGSAVMGLSAGLHSSNMEMADSMGGTIDMLVSLGKASGKGASAVLEMAEKSSDFAQQMAGVLGAKERESLMQQLTGLRALFAARGVTEFDTNQVLESLSAQMQAATEGEAGGLARLVGGDLATQFMTKGITPGLLAMMAQAIANNPQMKTIAGMGGPVARGAGARIAGFEAWAGAGVLQERGIGAMSQSQMAALMKIDRASVDEAAAARENSIKFQTSNIINVADNTAKQIGLMQEGATIAADTLKSVVGIEQYLTGGTVLKDLKSSIAEVGMPEGRGKGVRFSKTREYYEQYSDLTKSGARVRMTEMKAELREAKEKTPGEVEYITELREQIRLLRQLVANTRTKAETLALPKAK